MYRLVLLLAFCLTACAAPTPVVIELTPAPTYTPTTAQTLAPENTPAPGSTRPTVRPTATRIPSETPGPPTVTPSRTPTQPPSPTSRAISTVRPNLAPEQTPAQAGTVVPQPVQAISVNNAGQVSELARWGKGSVRALAYAPDGLTLRVQTTVGEFFYDTQTWDGLDATAAVQAVFADPEALTWEVQEAGMVIKRVRDAAVVSTLPHVSPSALVVFSPDKQLVAIGARWAEISVWQVATGRKLYDLSPIASEVCNGGDTNLAFSADSTWLVGGSIEFGCGYVWNMADGALVHYVDADDWVVFGVGVSPDKTRLVTVQTGGVVKVWQLPEERLLYTRTESSQLWWLSEATVAFAPDGATFTVGLVNGEVLVYNTADGALLAHLHSVAPTGEGVGFSADGKWLAVGAWGSVQVWRTDLGLRLRHNPRPTPTALNINYRRSPPTLPLPRSGPSMKVIDVAISPDGQMVAATFDDWGATNVALWRITDQGLDHLSLPVSLTPDYWQGVAFSPDGQWLALTAERALEVYRLADWGLVFHQPITAGPAALTFDAQGQTLAALDNEGRVSFFLGLAEGAPPVPVDFGSNLRALAFSPDGTTLALTNGSGFGTYTAGQYQYWVETLSPPEAALSTIYLVAFSPDGQLLATASTTRNADGSATGLIHLWRASDGQPLQTLSGHQGYITNLAFSPDGRFLASGSTDGSVRLWGVWP